MQVVDINNIIRINEVVEVHMQSFTGFFLTFLGRGFLKQLYTGFVEHPGSGLIVAEDDNKKIVGFLAYSDDLSGFYKYLVKKKLIPLAWYAVCAFLRNPKIMFRLLRAFTYSGSVKREEKYIELSSIGVLPETEGVGVGSKMIAYFKKEAESINAEHIEKFEYIKLETDAANNEDANRFYQKNGFVLDHVYETHEGRKMNEYRFNMKQCIKEGCSE